MVETFNTFYEKLVTKGHKPSVHVLDNECSKAIKNYITSQQTDIQLVEPHNHRENPAEPDVKCVQYHTLTSFSTLNPNFSIQLWCNLLEQVEITMNSLHTSQWDITKLVYEDFHHKNSTGTARPFHLLEQN